jgi:hypothetical protein
MLNKASDNEVHATMESAQKLTLDNIPAPIQAVERQIRALTEVVAAVCGD